MAIDPGVAALVLAAGVLVGILSALFGVGGGILMVPFMVLVLERSQHVAEGTSLLVIVPTAIAGVLAHHRKGFVSFRAAALLAAGGIGGAWAGAAIALQLHGDALQAIFGGALLVMGLRTVVVGVSDKRRDRPAE